MPNQVNKVMWSKESQVQEEGIKYVKISSNERSFCILPYKSEFKSDVSTGMKRKRDF